MSSKGSDNFSAEADIILEDNPHAGVAIIERLEEKKNTDLGTDELSEHVSEFYRTSDFEVLVNRKLRKMENKGIVEKQDGYRLTSKGKEVHEVIDERVIHSINTYNDLAVMIQNVDAGKTVMEELRDCKSSTRQELEDTAGEHFERYPEIMAGRKVNKMEDAGLITEINGEYYSTIHGVKMYDQLFEESLDDTEPNGHLTGS